MCELLLELPEYCCYALSSGLLCICIFHAERRMGNCELYAPGVDGCYGLVEFVCLLCMNIVR